MKGKALLLAVAVLASACSKPAPRTTVQQFMEGQVNPAGEFLFHSVAEVSDAHGVYLKAPKTAQEWQEVLDQVAVLQGAPDVLTAKGVQVAPPGFKSEHPGIESEPAWIQHAIETNRADFNRRAMRLKSSADAVARAAQAHDAVQVEKALDGVDKACESCHLRYFYPNDKRAWLQAREDNAID